MYQPANFSRRALLIGALGALSFAFIESAKAAEPLVLIVHPKTLENPSTADLAAIFTTRKQNWSDGSRVVAFNFPAKHEVRIEFDRKILEMGPDDVASYWIDRRIRGGNAPPKQIPSGALITKLVEKLEGSIAYVPESLVSSGVRIVRRL
jgi:hypothetical protein